MTEPLPRNTLGAVRERGLARRDTAPTSFSQAAPEPHTPSGPTPGIDVSNWQGIVDWAQVRASGVRFGICKSSESTTFYDPYFAGNWTNMQAHDVARGAYHFCQPDQNTPQAEAAFFLSCVNRAGGLVAGDLLVGDFEAGSGNLLSWARTFLDVIAQTVGFLPVFYSGWWFMQPHGLYGDDQLAQHGLWLAEYDTTPPTEPPNWPVVAFWQFTCTGTVPGVAGDTDMNLFNGSIEQLKRYGLPGGA